MTVTPLSLFGKERESMSDQDMYNAPSNSIKSREERPVESNEQHGVTPRKKGFGSYLRKMVSSNDADSLVHIFGNAMINAVGDAIDEVTGNLAHRAKTILYDTEDYDRGRRSREGRGASYRRYYDERNSDRRSSRDSSSDSAPVKEYKRWKYDEIFFEDRAFGGLEGARKAAQRVIKRMEDQVVDCDCVSVGDYIRYCKKEDPDNPMLQTEFTDEWWGWQDEELIANLRPVKVVGGYIIELPKPVSLH